jgi:hypothetical protein
MGVDIAKRLGLGFEMLKAQREHGVFENVGEIAGVESMTVIHGAGFTRWRSRAQTVQSHAFALSLAYSL